MDELLGLCSGRFGDPSQSTPPPGDKRTSRSLFSQPEMDDDNAQAGDMEELLGLCSGRFTDRYDTRSRDMCHISTSDYIVYKGQEGHGNLSFIFACSCPFLFVYSLNKGGRKPVRAWG